MNLSARMQQILKNAGYDPPESIIPLIENYYLTRGCSTHEVSQHLHVSQSFVKYVIRECNFKKSNEQINAEMVRKMQATNLQRYGVINVLNTPEAVKKLEQTNLQRYGHRRPFGSQEIQDKAHQSQVDLYGGVGNASSTLYEKYKLTSQLRYGANNPMQNEEISQRASQSRLRLYPKGSEAFRISRIRREFTLGNQEYDPDYDTLYSRDKFIQVVQSSSDIEEISSKIHVSYTCIRAYAKEYGIQIPKTNTSSPEKRFNLVIQSFRLKVK